MKTSVILNKFLVKRYYKNKFIKNFLLLEILILFIGSYASTYYLLLDELKFSIALEVLTVFFVIIIYFMNRNEKTKALDLIGDREREYIFEFTNCNLIINEEKNIKKEISYADLKIKKMRELYVFKNKNKNIDTLIYIIPKEFFKKEDWKNIFKTVKNPKEDE